jgi:hypothetical protein
MHATRQTGTLSLTNLRRRQEGFTMRAGGLTAKVRYGVFQIDSQWMLCCEQYHLGRYSSQLDAISAGKRAACQAMGSGFDAELLIMDVGGELRQADPASFGH